MSARRKGRGFTLIEVMIVVAIVGILTMIAYPTYTQQIVRTRRAAAAGCVLEMAQFMERVYTGNLRYDQNNGVATALPTVQCVTDLGGIYVLAYGAGQPQARTFVIEARPQGAQADRDAKCAILSMDQANTRNRSGSGTVAECWR
jgi:type IV pilus assembly protein PilE